jgi:threonine/homoserine/homoserine lactone efflux protein
MSSVELAIATLVLLLTPGPTNSLMVLAGAERGLLGTARLIPAELAGYFLTILPLALVGDAVLDDHQGLRTAVTLAAAGWVAALALRLWQAPRQGGQLRATDARAIFVTTALNPKALIFGLVLLPSPDRLAFNLSLFAALVVAVALIWALVGAAIAGPQRQPQALFLLRRLASVWLAAVSIALMMKGVGA